MVQVAWHLLRPVVTLHGRVLVRVQLRGLRVTELRHEADASLVLVLVLTQTLHVALEHALEGVERIRLCLALLMALLIEGRRAARGLQLSIYLLHEDLNVAQVEVVPVRRWLFHVDPEELERSAVEVRELQEKYVLSI